MTAMADPAVKPTEVAKRLGITTTTLYTYIKLVHDAKSLAGFIFRILCRPLVADLTEAQNFAQQNSLRFEGGKSA